MILISGASGFIGNEVINQLTMDFRVTEHTKEIDVLDHLPNCHGVDHLDLALPISSDIFDGITTVINLAGLAHSLNFSENDHMNVNFEGTVEMARVAEISGVNRFIHISTTNVYGLDSSSSPLYVDSVCQPKTPYSQTKHLTELSLREIEKRSDMEVVIIRAPLVYGANALGNFNSLMKFIHKVPLLPFGLVCNQRDFISVQNLAHLLSTCATNPEAAGHTFLASEGETVSTKEFTNAIAKGLGKKIYQLPIPVSLMRFAGKLLGKSAMVEQLVGNLQVDSSDLKKVLGWTPPYTMEESMTFLKKTK
ncbi:UDP-glucose 4-epimerase [Vibrio chagasii]|nr:UDP-glucose 4-epimerase [Vibrio chagasii]CAH6806230.1 UDP-glucose 4-epimerase [Vibrio chagasii]CAH6904173.1 UDP-glucose 4-epimerase [Vibrio chagasii]CAH6940711.1 UDP-glucose 4-epimerase [Vibrio chagasii]CAH6957539.1 UDP-glucose 4-epimerase [Vibrio chagasii]